MRNIHLRTLGLGLVIAALSLMSLTGSGLAVGPVVDLSQNQQDFRVLGAAANAYTGEVTSAADFNADGIEDLLIGAGGYTHNGMTFAGAAYMVFGRTNLSGDLNLNAGQSANLTVYGPSEYSALGHAVATGDVNGDGHQDIIISADGYDGARGAVHVIPGGPGRFATNTLIDLSLPNPAEKPALTLLGAQNGNRFGRSLASADVNGDGIDDIIVGAYKYWPDGRVEAGAVYVFYGSPTLFTANPDPIYANSANVRIWGAGEATSAQAIQEAMETNQNIFFADDVTAPLAGIGDRLGRSVAAGDVNGDGIADLILGAYGADVGAKTDAGKVYVLYGGSALPNTIDLKSAAVPLVLTGVDAGDQAGFFVGSGYVNGDRQADILVSAYLARGVNNNAAETGEVYVVYGASFSNQTISLTNANVTIYGANAGDRLGRSLAAADVVGLGFEDLILGASRANPDGRADAGMVYVIKGGSLPGQILLSQPANSTVRVLGASSSGVACIDNEDGTQNSDCSDEAGRSVSAGDLNGDGALDLIVGALFVNNGAIEDAGAVYVILGEPRHLLYLPVIFR